MYELGLLYSLYIHKAVIRTAIGEYATFVLLNQRSTVCTVVLRNHLKSPTLSLTPPAVHFGFKSVCIYDAWKKHILIAFIMDVVVIPPQGGQEHIKLYGRVCAGIVHFGGVEHPKFRRFMAPKWFIEHLLC